MALQKDAGIDPGVLAWLLGQFPLAPLPTMLTALTLAELRRQIGLLITELARLNAQAYLTWAFDRLGTHRDLFALPLEEEMTTAAFKKASADSQARSPARRILVSLMGHAYSTCSRVVLAAARIST